MGVRKRKRVRGMKGWKMGKGRRVREREVRPKDANRGPRRGMVGFRKGLTLLFSYFIFKKLSEVNKEVADLCNFFKIKKEPHLGPLLQNKGIRGWSPSSTPSHPSPTLCRPPSASFDHQPPSPSLSPFSFHLSFSLSVVLVWAHHAMALGHTKPCCKANDIGTILA